MQVPHQSYQRARASVGGNDGCPIWTPEWVLWMIIQCPRKEATVHVQQICQGGQYMQSKMLQKVARTHFPDCQNDVALQREGDRLWVGPDIWLCRCTPEAGNLQSRGHLISPKLPIELQNGGIGGRPCPKHLVVDSRHAFGREPVLPSINCPKVS